MKSKNPLVWFEIYIDTLERAQKNFMKNTQYQAKRTSHA